MTSIDRLDATCRLAEAYMLLHKLDQLEDSDAFMAKMELSLAIKDAEQVIISQGVRDSV